MLNSVAIEGDGVAACCCAQLLHNSHLPLQVERSNRSAQLTVLVSPSTQRLLADVFDDADLLSDLPIIRKRVVLWGRDSQPTTLPHFGVAVTESTLVNRLWGKLGNIDSPTTTAADWRLISRRDKAPGEEQGFGSRIAAAMEVQLTSAADRESCWIESVPAGWLFLLPSGLGRALATGSLICVGDTPETLIKQSRLVVQQLASVGEPAARFPAYPRIAAPLCAPGWLACGSAAMAFDPICGEGAGNAVREAILASAVLRAIGRSTDPQSVLDHYSSRLLAGFLRHLEVCRQFYLAARTGDWWDAELALLETGIGWTRARLASLPALSHRLVNFDLEQLGASENPL